MNHFPIGPYLWLFASSIRSECHWFVHFSVGYAVIMKPPIVLLRGGWETTSHAASNITLELPLFSCHADTVIFSFSFHLLPFIAVWFTYAVRQKENSVVKQWNELPLMCIMCVQHVWVGEHYECGTKCKYLPTGLSLYLGLRWVILTFLNNKWDCLHSTKRVKIKYVYARPLVHH